MEGLCVLRRKTGPASSLAAFSSLQRLELPEDALLEFITDVEGTWCQVVSPSIAILVEGRVWKIGVYVHVENMKSILKQYENNMK